ncbi:MAG: hypothetical protein VYA55_00550 [Pseudomonadota bacterium]|nr:hypothetical protein [Pseudomonadota bacterium]
MVKRNLAVSACAIISVTLSSTLQADSFDDAVNLYLKGFDHCVEARNAVGSNNVQKARSEFGRYLDFLDKAKAIDGSIIGSSRREMDSNLKFCDRVRHDMEIIIGTPMIEEAFAACEQTFSAIEQKNVDQANMYHQQFIELKDKAIEAAPSLKSVFSITSQIRRCERAEKKIGRLNSSQNVAALIKSVDEDITNFNAYCDNGLKETTGSPLSYAAITAANSTLKTARSLEQAAVKELNGLKAEVNDPAAISSLTGKLAGGQQCLGKLTAAVNKKESGMVAAEATLQTYASQLADAGNLCKTIGKIPPNNTAAYQKAKTSYESARSSRTAVQRRLAKDPLYNSAEGPSNAGIKQQLAALNRCLADAESELKAVIIAAPRPAPVAIASVPVKTSASQAEAKATPPATKAVINLDMEGLTPEWVLAYWEEATASIESVDIELLQSGFGKPLYIATPKTTLKFISGDFSTNQIFAEVEQLNYREKLAQLRYRQRGTAAVNWQPNSVATLKSNQERVAPSYVANVTSTQFSQLAFDENSQSLNINLANPGTGKTGYILMPGYDPVKFTIGQGEEAQYDVKTNDSVSGRMTIKGE